MAALVAEFPALKLTFNLVPSLLVQIEAFAEVVARFGRVDLLFNNAGIGGGGSLFTNTREAWERTFNICWGGVYLGVRTFLPLMMKANEAHIVNTSSVNGFWASIGPGRCTTHARITPICSASRRGRRSCPG